MSVRKLYDHPLSGNGHKVRLLMSMLGLEHEHIFTDVPAGKVQHEPAFVALNPLRQIPVLLDGDVVLWDSQAILVYLARAYGPQWLPEDAPSLGRVMQWLSFAANEIGNSLQPARVYYLLGEHIDIDTAQRKGRRVLAVLDAELATRDWLSHDRPTIADLACFPYVGLCREGKLPLDEHPHILGWIDRIRSLPGYIPMRGLQDPRPA
jgi:glutathione S-transferase